MKKRFIGIAASALALLIGCAPANSSSESSTKEPTSTIGIGATGAEHDRSIDRAIVEATDVKCIVAGGLDASNVAEAIHMTHPYGVDSCTRTNLSSAETDSLGNGKDPEKVKQVADAIAHERDTLPELMG